MKKYLNKPSITQQHKKKIDKMQKSMTKYTSERDMAEWEEQFRGGHGIHGYYRGGMSMDDYPQQRPSMDFNKMLDAMSMQESSNDPKSVGPLRRTAFFAAPTSDRP